ncbi:MAG: Unknown protein [uncultured Thiotrichaceae bacterium]|uniref:Uncharacterized protein n=1 Tax=uncultured Thiotrichaceae bacterium TaxID=298394 RepID=A0A6S6TGF0_9GAMM|nr:MAG: Unknown protein [uncultured Thiotrichaceae bacterium]
MSDLRKVIYLVLVIYLGFRGYSLFLADKPESEVMPPISEEER